MNESRSNREIVMPSGGEIRPAGPEAPCRYCGAPLHSMFYFCISCGTPYRDIQSILTPASPPVLTEGDLIERKAPDVAKLFWTYVTVLVGTWIVAYLLFEESRPDLSLLLMDSALFITTCIVGVIYRRTLIAQLKRIGFGRPEAWLGLAALIPLLAINYAYHGWIIEQLPGDSAMDLQRLRESGLGETFLVISFCIYPAIAEELAFRGLIQHWLATAIKPWRALVLASFLFTVMHFSIISFPYLFAVGMLLGWVKWRTGSLYPSMLIHFAHNLVVIEWMVDAW